MHVSYTISSGALLKGKTIMAFLLMLIGTIFTACNKNKLPLNSGAAILLFSGRGTSPNDVKAFEALLNENKFTYSTINSTELNAMTEQQLLKYKLLIVPGGNFIDMGKSLTDSAAANIRKAVQHGLSYHGVCAGGFLAGGSKYYRCFDLTSGATFGFYSISSKGARKAAVDITCVGQPTLQHYWEDGPQFTGWGTVAAKYPDGTPAVVQGRSGKGQVILSGIHAEAPDDWRDGMTFNTSAKDDNAYAVKLIRAALKGEMLAHY
jgi:glutamine amidotransferase-like uncharacterized protein